VRGVRGSRGGGTSMLLNDTKAAIPGPAPPPPCAQSSPFCTAANEGLRGRRGEMVAIKLYDLETGHVETLAEVTSAEAARAWLERFKARGIGTNDVVYTSERDDS
jgi:hypothetical protein